MPATILATRPNAQTIRVPNAAAGKAAITLADTNGRLITTGPSAIIGQEDRPVNQRPLTKGEHDALHCLSQIGGATGVSASEWLRATELPERSFYRARQRLLELDAVVCEGRRYRMTLWGQAVVEPPAPLLP